MTLTLLTRDVSLSFIEPKAVFGALEVGGELYPYVKNTSVVLSLVVVVVVGIFKLRFLYVRIRSSDSSPTGSHRTRSGSVDEEILEGMMHRKTEIGFKKTKKTGSTRQVTDVTAVEYIKSNDGKI